MVFPMIRRKVKWFVKHITLFLAQKDIKSYSLLRKKEKEERKKAAFTDLAYQV